MKTFDVEIEETYKCIACVMAETEEKAIELVKKLHEDNVIEVDHEDFTETHYSIIK